MHAQELWNLAGVELDHIINQSFDEAVFLNSFKDFDSYSYSESAKNNEK
jgi:hypothetical protein